VRQYRYEPVQPIVGIFTGVTVLPLHTAAIDFDVVQRLQHGTVVIR
jgi:hypothetical protein